MDKKILIGVIMVSIFITSAFIPMVNSNNYNINNDIVNGRTESWHLNGHTLIKVDYSSKTAILTIDVTSFSKSSGAGPTVMYFVVNGNGVYTYNWNYNIYGCIHLSARYMSMCSNQIHYSKPELNKDMISDTGTVKSFSSFGDSSIYLYKFYNYIGYDGNNTVYLSDIDYQPTYPIYGNTSLTDSTGAYNGNGIANNSVIIGKTAYTEADDGEDLFIRFNMTDIGAGHEDIKDEYGIAESYMPARLITCLQTENAESNVIVNFNTACMSGYNISNINTLEGFHDVSLIETHSPGSSILEEIYK